METKTFCSNCRVHCYRPDMRAEIREVMRFSGPRMMLHHPVMAVRHLLEMMKEKKNPDAGGKPPGPGRRSRNRRSGEPVHSAFPLPS